MEYNMEMKITRCSVPESNKIILFDGTSEFDLCLHWQGHIPIG